MIKKMICRAFLTLIALLCLCFPIWAQNLNVVDGGGAWPQDVLGTYVEDGTNNGRPSYSGPNGYWLYSAKWEEIDCWMIGSNKGEGEVNSSGVRFFIVNSSGTPPLNTNIDHTNSGLGAVKVTTATGSPPPAPGGVSIHSTTASSFGVNWSDVSSATGYKLEVSTDSGFTSLISGYTPYIISIPADTPIGSRPINHVVSGLAPGNSYYFRMRAYNGFGDSVNSSVVSTVSIPAPPSVQDATNVSDSGFRANWSTQTGATSYLLYVSDTNSFSSHILNGQYTSESSYAVTGLLPNTTYYYRVKAANSSGQSGMSGIMQVTTAPVIPTAKAASDIQSDAFIANWQASEGATGYYIDVATDESFSNMVTGYSSKNIGILTSFPIDNGLSPYTTYYYRVRAYNASGVSSNSQTISVTTLPVLPSVTTESVSLNGDGSIQMEGNITSLGVPTPTQHGFVWNTTGSPTTDDDKIEKGATTATGIFTFEASELAPNTTYYIRAYAKNSAGTTYGDELIITTPKKSLTITVDNKNKVFGEDDPEFTVTYDGFIDEDTSSGLDGTLGLDRDLGEDVGVYAINATGLTSEKYEITFVPGTLTIERRLLIIETENKSKTYGEEDPAFTYLLTSGELIDSDEITGELTRELGENAGSYAIKQGTLTAGSNYDISCVEGSLSIEKKALTITAEDKSKSYGEDDPEFTVSYNGFVTGEDESNLSGTLSITREPGEDVGTYEIIPSGLTSTNYEIIFENGVLSIISNDANLSNLSVSNGTIQPAFDPNETSYTVDVGSEVIKITVTPTASDTKANIKVNGSDVNSGEASQNIPLVVGNNTVNIEVTAENGDTKTYEILVTREASNDNSLSHLLISNGLLQPAFDPTIENYTVNVANEVTAITITPIVNYIEASVTVNGSKVNSGEASQNIPLILGNNVVCVVVTAESGVTKTYTITITRSAPIDSSVPYIVATDPVNYAENVSVSKPITITFSEDIFAEPSIDSISLKKGTIAVDYTHQIQGNQLTITPTSDLDYGTMYTLTIPKHTIRDEVNNRVEDTFILTFTTEYALENNTDLSGLTVTRGKLVPSFDRNITSYMVTVDNSIGLIQITPTAAGKNSTITVNGDTVKSGHASKSIALNVGDNTIQILVTAKDGANKSYTIVVKRKQKDDGNNSSSSTGSGSSSNTSSNDGLIDIYVNGDIFLGANTHLTEQNGQTTMTVAVDDEKIQRILKDQRSSNTITIRVRKNVDKVVGILNGETAKLMNDKNGVLEIQTTRATYRLSAKEIVLGLTEKFGQDIEWKDSRISIEISDTTDENVQIIEDTAKQNGYQILVRPVTFTVSCSYGERKVEIASFSQYVERIMPIPEGTDARKITTGIVVNSDGSFTHVPTSIVSEDGKVYAKINSMTNSTYSVIYNPISMDSVENHWAKEAVNDMASRLIITNPQSFKPKEEITREAFAEYITKALGLYRIGAKDAIAIAVEYGIMRGYPDGTFRPQAKITREEAMTMYAKAMDIVRLQEKANNRITNYKDKNIVSSWAYDSVKKALSRGVFNGKTQEIIDPKGTLTHAEAATAIRNLLIEAGLINP